jgi:hypothetical protein
MDSARRALSLSLWAALRWLARILTVLIILIWGFFVVAHLVGDEGRASRPLNTNDYILLGSMLVSLVGLAIAWKWELVGAVVTLAAFLVGAVVNWNLFASLFLLIPITAVLYLACWWLEPRQRSTA